MVGGCVVRLTARVPADLGRVAAVTVRLEYDGTEGSDGIDVTDVQLQAGDVSGVVPHPSDLELRSGGRQWRNGMVPKSMDVIVLANPDLASPVTLTVRGNSDARVGSFRFGRFNGFAQADGAAATATQGWGRVPVITARSDLPLRVAAERPLHLIVGWHDRSQEDP